MKEYVKILHWHVWLIGVKFDEGFVDSSPCPLNVLDTKGGEDFIDKEKAAIMCTKMIEDYEKCGLPIEE